MTPTPESTLSERNTPRGRLQGVRDVLNAVKDTERGKEVVRLVGEWMAAPSLSAFYCANDDRRAFGVEVNASIQVHLLAGMRHKYCLPRFFPTPPNEGNPHTFTVWLFAHLVTNPLCEKLAGPCARCGLYYIKKRASQNVYCSRRCGNATTALARTRERIQVERSEKLDRAKAAMRKWERATTQQDWKSWVAQKTKIDARFLTRAVHKGDLVPPQKRR